MNNKLNILYAEDDTVSNEALTYLLRKIDIVNSVDSSLDGLNALEKIKANNNYDVLITDIKMPKLTGIELIHEAKKINKKLNTILITAHNEVDYLHKAIDLSVDKYLLKPLDSIKLKEQLEFFYKKKQQDIKKKEKEKKNQISLRKEAINDTIYNISHQWRQPLNLIALEVSHLQLAKTLNKLNSNDVDESLNNILKTANKLSNTINEFEDAQKESPLEEVNIKSYLLDTLNCFKTIFLENSVNLKIQIDDLLTYKIYKEELASIVKDIILNSVEQFKYKQTINPEIEIKALKKDENLILEICDNGGGIEEEVLPKIYEPYFTTRFATEDKGLGLYLSHKLIENKFHGKIKASNIEDGACFKITIPKLG